MTKARARSATIENGKASLPDLGREDGPQHAAGVSERQLTAADGHGTHARIHDTLHMDSLAGRYRILSRLGAGGMGEVFLAEDTRLERRVAVKLLPSAAESDRLARERLRREALAAAALDHPFICKIYEIGEADGRAVHCDGVREGETLHAAGRARAAADATGHRDRERARRGARRGPRAGSIVHRDLKPANVMLTPQRSREGDGLRPGQAADGQRRVSTRIRHQSARR